MKRNESILVYGVTGLLVLILFVAVVFGNEGEPLATPGGDRDLAAGGEDDAALELAELMNLDPAASLRGEGELGDDGAAAPVAAEPSTDPEGHPAAGGAETAGLGTSGSGTSGFGDIDEASLVVDAGGAGEYREVTVRRGDTFSLLVQQHTGSLEQMSVVEALNEDVDRDNLRPGVTLLMPWVDQQTLDSAARERRFAENRRDTFVDTSREAGREAGRETPARQPVAALGATERRYTLKKGDSLWDIAVQATGSQNQAPAFVKKVLDLNPGLRPERLQVGQSIKLP